MLQTGAQNLGELLQHLVLDIGTCGIRKSS